MRFLAQSIVAVLVLGVAACGGQTGDSDDNTSRSTNTKDDEDEDDSAKDESDDSEASDGGGADDGQGEDDAADDGRDDATGGDGKDDDSTGDDVPAGSATGSPATPPMTTPTATPTSAPPAGTSPIAPPPIMVPGKPIPGGMGTPAEGCSEPTKTVGSNYCEQSVSCTNDYVYASCSGRGDGTWECNCNSYYTSAAYQLTDVTEETACGPVLEYCKSGNPPTAELGDTVCDAPQIYADPSYCSSNQTCRRTGAISDTVSSIGYDSRYANCSATGTGTISCSCGSNTMSAQYELTNAALDTACTTVSDLCGGAITPEFPAEPTCTQTSRTEGKTQCDVSMQCTRSAELDSGEGATLSEYKSAYCSSTLDGAWSCNCSTPSRYLSFQLAADTLADDRCVGSIAFCETDTPIEPAGEITCTNSYQSISGDYCSAQSTCVQQADVDGVSIGLLGSVSTSCTSDGAGGFTCSCSSDTETAAVTADGEDLWTVCENASILCPDVVKVNIGTGGGNVGIGRPIPVDVAVSPQR